MRVVEQELEKLELSIGEHLFLPLVAQYSTIGVKPKALQFPNALVPKVEAIVVPGHLCLDEGDVDVGRLLSYRVKLGQLSFDPIQEAQLEADQVVIDAHPMTCVLPVLGLDVLSFEGTLGRCSFGTLRHLITIRNLVLSRQLLNFFRRSVYHWGVNHHKISQVRPTSWRTPGNLGLLGPTCQDKAGPALGAVSS
jgi:hypothetical protein